MAESPTSSTSHKRGLFRSLSGSGLLGSAPLMKTTPTDNGPPPEYTDIVGVPGTSDEPPPERPQDVPLVAVMGPTGSGKSTFISKLGGSTVEIGHNLMSRKCLQQSKVFIAKYSSPSLGTQDITEVRCKIGDRYVMLVDTPGFNDTVRTDTEILGLLVDWMKSSHGERQFSGLIYLHDISGARMTGSILQNLRMFRKLCGDDNLGNVILATTKWGITPTADALLREKELSSEGGFWGFMKANGSKIKRFDNTEANARSLVEELLYTGRKGFTPKLQHEVVTEGKTLSQTAAGAFIEEALARQAKIHQEEMKALLEEQERAHKKRMETGFSSLLCSDR